MELEHSHSILQPGRNCWRIERAQRAAFLVDGAACFRAVREAVLQARHSVFIVGWDIHSRLALVRDGPDDGEPRELGELLNSVAHRHGVEVYVLSWDFAMIYAMEREPVPLFVLNWKSHARVHFCSDGKHPVGASQHQKLVVVDDALAFSGGLDLSHSRWDTPQHRLDEPLRVNPQGKPYPPFHDVQMLVDGDAAAALGQLARERWRRVSDLEPRAPQLPVDPVPWPASVSPALADVDVGIARTSPAYESQPEVCEVEQLYIDSIASAERSIYIENQYLTAHCIREALTRRLERADAPDVVIVMPEKTGGWLEQYTMDVLRSRLVKQLREVGAGGRLRIYYPQLSSTSDVSLMVHAKVMIVDDRLVRIASSNLSNRSMGLDSECDLAIEAQPPDRDTRMAIRRFRDSLLAEHLDVSEEQIASSMQRSGSLIETIETLRGGERTLQPLIAEVDDDIDQMVPESALLDPERPIDPERFVDQFVPRQQRSHSLRRGLVSVLILAALLALAAAWRWTPLGEWLEVEALIGYAGTLNQQPASALLAIVGIALAAVLMVPVTLLVVAVVLGFGSWPGFLYALAGAELGAILSYAIGRGLGRDLVRRYAGQRLNSVSKQLSKRGLLTIITLRIVPVAPFAVINLVAGASHIRFRDFALGSVLGLLPGVLAIAVFADQLLASIRSPDSGNLAWLVAVVLVILGLLLWLRKWLLARSRQSASEETES
ncbi:MAG: VTT domain-containing protein [Thiogranum sp.]|nr:VTT domain-containing protein [Thiogranum sp.]